MTNVPSFVPDVHLTPGGTPYLKEPGLSLVAMPRFIPEGATAFIASFGEVFDAADYENDWFEDGMVDLPDYVRDQHRSMDDAASLCKLAGQTCYLSFGDNRTRNDATSAKRYFDNIKSSGHGSVLEHACFSMLVWGVDRAFSHELVRHRAGWAYSQLSQRYVSGKTLRFVERPEYQDDPVLHERFCRWADRARDEYDTRATLLASKVRAEETLYSSATERRKAVNQAARNCLPNETETALVLTGNVRAWRHVLETRGSVSADVPISMVTQRAYEILRAVSPVLFDDYDTSVRSDGRTSLSTPNRKV